MSEDQSKKRKLEGGESMPTQTEVRSMISMWSQEQLMTALSILGSGMPDVLAHIQTENDRDPKMRKLFVRNLNFESNSETLQKVFAELGTIEEAVVIMNKSTGRSKGFGFVTFTTAAEADKVVRMGTVDIDGRGAYVSLAAKGRSGNGPQHSSGPPSFGSRGPSYGGGGGGGPSANAPLSTDQAACKLFIRQLDFKTTSDTLHQVFSEFGPVKEAVVLEHPSGGSKGYGFITFENSAGAQAALVEPSKTIDGRMTMTKLAADHSDRPQRNQQQPPPSSYGGYGGYGGSGGYGGYTGGYNAPTGGYNAPTGGYNAPPPPMPNFGMPEAPPSAPFGGIQSPPAPYGMPPAPLGSMGWPPSYN